MFDKLKKMQIASVIAFLFVSFACIYMLLVTFVPASADSAVVKDIMSLISGIMGFIAGWLFASRPADSQPKKSTEEDV